MTKTERITRNIEANKEIIKGIENVTHYDTSRFIEDAKSYIKAIKEGRMINSIGSVSKSGMSRNIKFLSCEKERRGNKFYYSNYFCLFKALGFNESRNKDHYFTIGGCGMDMIFHTNYTIIHRLCRLGFITKKECASLAQDTPHTI